MKRQYETADQALSVAKQAMYLAWKACGGPRGMGVLQDRGPNQDINTVWDHAYNERDYTGTHKRGGWVDADYVMGRMMKLYFKLEDSSIEYPDREIRGDYQSWCYEYPSYSALFDAAESACAISPDAAASVTTTKPLEHDETPSE